jgi:hypothetical protein
MAEAISLLGKPGQADCAICGALLAHWQQPKLKAFRLVIAVENSYPTVPGPPSSKRQSRRAAFKVA